MDAVPCRLLLVCNPIPNVRCRNGPLIPMGFYCSTDRYSGISRCNLLLGHSSVRPSLCLAERSFGMEVTKRPKIKDIPYNEFIDNDSLEELVKQLNQGRTNVILGVLDDVVNWGRSNSLWPLTFATSCCGIEFMALGAARYDMARFGFEVARSSPRQADMIMVAGTITHKMAPVLKRLYDQMADPKYVIAVGGCAVSG